MITTKRFATCDHPDCDTVIETGPSVSDLGEGWRKVRSTDHITTDQRRRNDSAASGAFHLELCPEHTEFFDAHRPQTVGTPGRRGRDGSVYVTCSCGASLGRTTASYQLAPRDTKPSYYPERLWWGHLPAELRAYSIQRDGDPR